MPQFSLLNYSVIKKANLAEPNRIILADPDDEVTVAGPVRLCVILQASNQFVTASGEVSSTFHDVVSYTMTIPAGRSWRMTSSEASANLRLATNLGTRVVICPAGPKVPSKQVKTVGDLPCDFAVGDIADTGEFFPAGCEPCPPGKPISVPPGTTPTLITPPAPGGCVRTHFFNGMFITREDLETEQRYSRMKNKLQNQAMGEGVVWGLDLSCDGGSICVHPGYALDCCGNALTVTTTYKVDFDSLLRDPKAFLYLVHGPSATALSCAEKDVLSAADSIRGVGTFLADVSRRMHLLLEYVECPEAPRPVHGDPCSPEVTQCEMSRIRETVRLRLVPPRDYDPRGPIDKFLKEVAKLKKSGQIPDQDPTPPVDPGQRGCPDFR